MRDRSSDMQSEEYAVRSERSDRQMDAETSGIAAPGGGVKVYDRPNMTSVSSTLLLVLAIILVILAIFALLFIF